MLSGVRSANKAWVQHSLDTVLKDEELNCEIYLAGVCPYAPYQWEVVREVIDAVQPAAVALDLPGGMSESGEVEHPE